MPFVYQAPRCAEARREREIPICADPRCEACYGKDAEEVELCGEHDSDTGMFCQLPATDPGEYHSYVVTFGYRDPRWLAGEAASALGVEG